MARDAEIEQFAGHFLNLLDPRIAEFHHLFTVGADKVVVLPVLVRFLELCLIFSKLMANNQVTGKQQLDGIVQCGATYPILLVFHVHVERFDIEMPCVGVNFIEYGEAFGCFTMPVLFQIIGENLLYRFFGFLVCHFRKRSPKVPNFLLAAMEMFAYFESTRNTEVTPFTSLILSINSVR